MDGERGHGQRREYGDRILDCERNGLELPQHQVRGPTRHGSAEPAPAGRADARPRNRLPNGCIRTLGRLLDAEPRSRGRLHVLVHGRVHPDIRPGGLEDPDWVLQIPVLHRGHASTSATSASTSATTTSPPPTTATPTPTTATDTA